MHFPDTLAVVLAAGSSSRFGRDKLKLQLAGKSVISHALAPFLELCSDVIVMTPPDVDDDFLPLSLRKIPYLHRFTGGKSRHESLKNALYHWHGLRKNKPYILVHDGARPHVEKPLILRVMKKLREIDKGAVLPVLGVVDTVYQKTGKNLKVIPRETLLHAQTPQGFHLQELTELVQSTTSHSYTDEVSLYAEQHHDIYTVEGEYDNVKITSPNDAYRLMHIMTRNNLTKTGFGFDVHRMIAGNAMTLGGFKFACDYQLCGHSDADVVLHALTDAIYGVISMGDIGQHFPPDDQRWKNADSKIFLQHAQDSLAEKQGRLQHIDITIVAEYPKIAPCSDHIRASIASLCRMEIAQVSLKATTTEGLGFTGRGEGIAVYAQTTASFWV